MPRWPRMPAGRKRGETQRERGKAKPKRKVPTKTFRKAVSLSLSARARGQEVSVVGRDSGGGSRQQLLLCRRRRCPFLCRHRCIFLETFFPRYFSGCASLQETGWSAFSSLPDQLHWGGVRGARAFAESALSRHIAGERGGAGGGGGRASSGGESRLTENTLTSVAPCIIVAAAREYVVCIVDPGNSTRVKLI